MSRKRDIKKVVLAYSGGLDTSVILKWLKETYGCEVVTFTADLGQGLEMESLQERAGASGAAACYVDDLRQEFVRDYIWPSLKAGALYQGQYPLATALGRPLIARRLVERGVRFVQLYSGGGHGDDPRHRPGDGLRRGHRAAGPLPRAARRDPVRGRRRVHPRRRVLGRAVRRRCEPPVRRGGAVQPGDVRPPARLRVRA